MNLRISSRNRFYSKGRALDFDQRISILIEKMMGKTDNDIANKFKVEIQTVKKLSLENVVSKKRGRKQDKGKYMNDGVYTEVAICLISNPKLTDIKCAELINILHENEKDFNITKRMICNIRERIEYTKKKPVLVYLYRNTQTLVSKFCRCFLIR